MHWVVNVCGCSLLGAACRGLAAGIHTHPAGEHCWVRPWQAGFQQQVLHRSMEQAARCGCC